MQQSYECIHCTLSYAMKPVFYKTTECADTPAAGDTVTTQCYLHKINICESIAYLEISFLVQQLHLVTIKLRNTKSTVNTSKF